MDVNLHWHNHTLLEQTATSLTKNGFGVTLLETRAEALAFLLQQAAAAESIGFGGSMTLAELGLIEALAASGKRLLVHGQAGLSPVERRQVMQEQLDCDLFITSSNAVTLKGHLVNIDATGNRVCAMAFGPREVLVVVGVNKVTSDIESALRRIKERVAPANARRLGFATPCAETGRCSDCQSPQRICRITTIIERAPRASHLHICLVNEHLGY
ncbi:MAG: lactate utilization protein C [Desulfuromonadales bacterium GWC2_61_20]|nr:MAG: lactate utilization protein C [Desulfuromonadales bacterium GWC2_61_20]HAD04514.1 lactate utilization protein C [Desulfuromonas sp.]HBT82240.1 lactate utilization protein C [Desulfuromonas sp.]